jgi:hypothetical protein
MPVICLALDRRPGARSFRQTDFSAVDGNNIIQCVSYKAQQNIRVTRGKVVASIGPYSDRIFINVDPFAALMPGGLSSACALAIVVCATPVGSLTC